MSRIRVAYHQKASWFKAERSIVFKNVGFMYWTVTVKANQLFYVETDLIVINLIDTLSWDSWINSGFIMCPEV